MKMVVAFALAALAVTGCSSSRKQESADINIITIVVNENAGGYLLQGVKVDERTIRQCFRQFSMRGFAGKVRIMLPSEAPVSSAFSLCSMLESNGITSIEINLRNRIREKIIRDAPQIL